jgi:twinkle protein
MEVTNEPRYKNQHLPCVSCNSSDALSEYMNGSAYCFSCETRFSPADYSKARGGDVSSLPPARPKHKISKPKGGEISAIESRSLTLATVKKFNVKVVKDEHGNDIKHYYPYYNGEEEVIKIRDVEKKRNNEAFQFVWTDGASKVDLFGKQLFDGGQRFVTLFEGEIDAMSGYQMLNTSDTNYAVLGVKSSSDAERAVRNNLEYLYSFDNVVLCFDMDEPGRKATDKVAKLLQTGKTKIVSLPSDFNDANEMLMAGQQKAFKDAWYGAKTYTPSGLVSVSDHKKRYLERPTKLSVPYPWQGLNEKLEGLRQGEIMILTAGTGLGKSAVCRELQHHLLKTTEDNIGIVMLEESYERTIDGLMSIEANERLSKDSIRDTYELDRLSEWHDALFEGVNKNRVWVYEHFGENNLSAIADRVKFMAAGSECKWIFIDHIHMISAAGGDNETAEINKIMHKFRDLCEELNISIVTVSHLRRLDGNKGHENGAEVNLSHLRGSHVIAQIADSVLALERNQQSEDEVQARTTRLRVLKNRYSGEVGEAGHIIYDPVTGRLTECDDSDLQMSNEESLI